MHHALAQEFQMKSKIIAMVLFTSQLACTAEHKPVVNNDRDEVCFTVTANPITGDRIVRFCKPAVELTWICWLSFKNPDGAWDRSKDEYIDCTVFDNARAYYYGGQNSNSDPM